MLFKKMSLHADSFRFMGPFQMGPLSSLEWYIYYYGSVENQYSFRVFFHFKELYHLANCATIREEKG